MTRTKTKKSVSKKLKRLLRNNGYAHIIKELRHYPNGLNYFDISVTDKSKISYLKTSRVPEKEHKLYDPIYRKGQAHHTKVGKVLAQVDSISQQDIQNISAVFYNNNIDNKFIATDKIAHYYNGNNYAEYGDGYRGNLFNSCMRSSCFTEAIKFYERMTPEIVQLLVLLDSNGKVLGRCLLWHKVNYGTDAIPNHTPYMDRFYVANDNIFQLFRQYAEDNNYAYYSSCHSTIYKNEPYGSCKSTAIKGSDASDSLPYMDTFQHTDYELTALSNEDGDYHLDSTQGASLDENSNDYECDFCGTRLDEDEYIYTGDGQYSCDDCVSRAYDDDEYYRTENMYYCESNREYYRSNEDLAEINGYYYHIDDCIYSNHYGEHILTDGAIKVLTSDGDSDFVIEDGAIYSKYYDAYLLSDDAEFIHRLDDVFFKNDTALVHELLEAQNIEIAIRETIVNELTKGEKINELI